MMRVGLSEQSGRKPGDPRAGARVMVERTAAARRAGLDSLFVGDHHATPGPYYQNVPITARMLAEWGDRPAGCLFLLPLWNPVLIAEQVGTLAAIAQGRFIIQAGLGDDEAQFAAMGTTVKTRVSAFEQSLDAVRRLLAGEVVSATGRFTFREARVALRPAEPVEVWIGANAPAAIDRAARLGDGFLAAPDATPERARERIQHYLERCAAYGRRPTAVAVRRDIYVADSPADAEAVMGPIRTGGYRGFDPAALVIGTVDQVTDAFRALGAMGYTDVIVRHVIDDQPRVLASLGRLAEVRKRLA